MESKVFKKIANKVSGGGLMTFCITLDGKAFMLEVTRSSIM